MSAHIFFYTFMVFMGVAIDFFIFVYGMLYDI